MRRAIVGAVLLAGLTACGGEGNTEGDGPSETVTVTEAPDGDTLVEGDPEDLETYGDDFEFPSEEVGPGDTFEVYLPPGDLGDGHVEITLGDFRTEESTNTEGNVYFFIPMNVTNIGTGVADLDAGLTWQWEGDDGLLETNVGVFSDDELEPQLGEGQRTEGEDMVDIPTDPGILTLFGMDKNVTIRTGE